MEVLISGLIAFGIIVIVPLTARLRSLSVDRLYWAGAAGAIFSLVIERGLVSGVLAVPWLLLTVRFVIKSKRSQSVPSCFLVIAGCWLAVSRSLGSVFHFSEFITALTVIHFIYIGFAGLTLFERLPGRVAKNLRDATVGLIVLVALGISFSPVLERFSAILLSGVVFVIGILQIYDAVTTAYPRSVRMLLSCSALSLLLGMVLSFLYAEGLVSLQFMLLSHGPLNAFGFVFCGLIGWLIVENEVKETPSPIV